MRTLNLLKYVFLSFFVIMDAIALIHLFPTSDSKDQFITLAAAIVLVIIMAVEQLVKAFRNKITKTEIGE